MTIEEKANFIKENKNKNYLFLSPRIIQDGATLVTNSETLELYENMDYNTSKFSEQEIVDLISSANDNDIELKKYLYLNLVYCGDFDDLPKDLSNPVDFILNNRDKIVAIYRYIKSSEEKERFAGFVQRYTINTYGFMYLNFAQLLEEFEKNNVSYTIDTSVDKNTPIAYRYGAATRFVLSYEPKIDLDDVKTLKRSK